MEKTRMYRILARADRLFAIELAKEINAKSHIEIIKEPEKVLAMIKMREPVKESLFYMGEVIVTEVLVSVNGINGKAVLMGDDYDKAKSIAIIDGACNANIFDGEEKLLAEEKKQLARIKKENAVFAKTMVNFNTMTT